MSNKSTGTKFESEFRLLLWRNGFWAHGFQDNRNGQPCDVIAVKNGIAWLFDCKNCQGPYFRLDRMEENQLNAMEMFQMAGNRRGMFAIQFPDKEIYLADYLVLQNLRDSGVKSIGRSDITLYGRTLEDWIQEQDVSVCRS